MHLHKHQAALLKSLLTGPLPYNALTHDVMSLFEHLGIVEDHGHNKLLLKIGQEQRVLPRPRGKHLTTEELSGVRHLLVGSGIEALASNSNVVENEDISQKPWVVVIDHHAARFYHATEASRPEAIGRTSPRDSHGFHRHLIHRKEANYQGDRVPEDDEFYKEIASKLMDAPAIVIIGHATGKSDAAAYLISYLEKHCAYIATRIVGIEVADISALTDPEVEALAERHLGFLADS